jgi:hypothetical protein
MELITAAYCWQIINSHAWTTIVSMKHKLSSGPQDNSLNSKHYQPSGMLIHRQNLYAPRGKQWIGCCEPVKKVKISLCIVSYHKRGIMWFMQQRYITNIYEYRISQSQDCSRPMSWRTTIVITVNGIRKWIVKNKVNVLLSAADQPQDHCTKWSSIYI